MSTEFSTDLVPYSPSPGGPSRPERGINIVRMLRLRAPLMIGIAAITAAIALPAVWVSVPRQYTATERLQFASEDPSIMYGQGGESTTRYERYVNSSAMLVQDAKFLTRVLIEPEVRSLKVMMAQPDRLTYLQDKLTARPIPRTELLEISGTFPDAESATTIVSMAAKNMEQWALDQEKEYRKTVDKSLLTEEETLKKQKDAQMLRIQNAQEKLTAPHLGVDNGSSGGALQALLGQAKQAASNAKSESDRADERLKFLQGLEAQRKKSPDQEILEANVEVQAKSDPQVSSFREQQMRLTTEIEASPYPSGSPRLASKEALLKSAQEGLAKSLREARRVALTTLLQNAEIDAQVKTKSAADAELLVTEYNNKLNEEQKNAGEIYKSQMNIENERQLLSEIDGRLQKVREQLHRIEVEKDAPPRVHRPSDGTMSPARPDYGKRMKLAVLALGGAIGLGMAAGLLRELTDQQLRNSEDVSYITPLPVLASIPHSPVDGAPNGAATVALLETVSDSAFTDEFRRILSRIVYPPEGAVEVKTILITSPSRGDGRTAMACNLALALANANRRVLIVDVCSRRPGIEASFDLEPAEGLAEVLAGDESAEELIRETEHENVFVLGPGLGGREVSGKLASREAVEFFEAAEEAFDHVIIDTPPSLIMSDAKLLSPRHGRRHRRGGFGRLDDGHGAALLAGHAAVRRERAGHRVEQRSGDAGRPPASQPRRLLRIA